MATEEAATTTELEMVEPMGEACMMGVQFAFDAALALF
ncbi:hypothetical protein HAPAU_01750 [Halalkalicoccus paucihalophilus]|jgi:hypothetical protein|uniref:Uncharacterized protein n=1 Tax=Halalkalicoccus paucihalophilus TaxID=1008153 RepID=A0A151AJC3_9EURY|nr:hypothetical protein HAPAU_01750 [Halalkalicoccus paucihalophilus]